MCKKHSNHGQGGQNSQQDCPDRAGDQQCVVSLGTLRPKRTARELTFFSFMRADSNGLKLTYLGFEMGWRLEMPLYYTPSILKYKMF
jgi:hypothetical protein